MLVLLTLLAGSAVASAALAAGPDTSARSFLILDDAASTTYLFGPLGTVYQQPTATATSTWALVGNSNLSGDAYIAGACCTDYNYVMNPVIVTGPFDGDPHANQYLLPPSLPDPASVERFGAALAINGDRVAVGSTEVLTEIIVPYPVNFPRWVLTGGGRVHLYLHDGTQFIHERTVVHGGTGERFGQAVDLRANGLLVGRPGASPGAADLFDPDSGAHITTFTSPASGDKFGEAVALLDDLALVGASGSGAVYVYRHDGNGTWTPAGTLTSPGAASEFGAAIDVDNGRILVGAPAINRAYVFEDDGDADWPVVAEITGGGRLGQAVALTGDTAFVGAPQLQFGSNLVGVVARHERASDGTWPFVSLKASRTPTNGDGFGSLVSASSTLLSVAQNVADSTRPGEFYIFSSQASIPDEDGDTVSDLGDNCDAYNPGQEDLDSDDIGDACDPDIDNDGLSNTEEANIGTDPEDADTDGDGLDDGNDPYPTDADIDDDGANDGADNCLAISNPGQGNVDGDDHGDACDDNIDGDPLSNTEEANIGTDPYNPDSDGDRHLDGEDFLPLDFKDGWAKKYQFQVEAKEMRLGANVLLVLQGDSKTLRSFAKLNGAWQEVPAPTIPGAPILELYGGGSAGGDRFVALAQGPVCCQKPLMYEMDWSAVGGWVLHSPIDFSAFPGSNLINATVGQNRIVSAFYPGVTNLVYDITPAGPVFREAAPQIEYNSLAYRAIAGDFLFSVRPDESRITAYNMLNGYSDQVITWPDPTEADDLGKGFYPVGANKALVDGRNNSFWMTQQSGVWSLQLSGIDKSGYSSKHISGGDGTVVVHSLDPDTQGGLPLWRVQRVSNAAEVGKFNEWTPGYSQVLTNGKVVVQARVVTGPATKVVDVFEVPAAAPPGC